MLTILENADLYDPGSRGICHVLLGGGRVLHVGEAGIDVPRGFPVEVSDLEGRRLIPGLVDCHAHLTGGGGEGGFRTRVPPLSVADLTRGGTTTVVGMLGTDDETRDVGALVAAAHGLVEEGITAYCLTGGYHVPPATLTGSVRRDVVHIDRIIGVGEIAVSDHRSSQPTLDEILRIASEAYVGGMISAKAGYTHLHLGDGERGLTLVREALEKSELPPRVFFPTHVNRRRALTEEAFELTARGVTIDVTASPVRQGSDEWSAAETVRQYQSRGLPPDRLTVSSDAGGSLPRFDADGRIVGLGVGRPGALVDTLRELLATGMDLGRALPAFTSNPAGVLGLAEKGHLRPGADADLVVLDADGSVRDVMARGLWHIRDGRVVRAGTFGANSGEIPTRG